MGIKGLNQFIKKISTLRTNNSLTSTVHISNFFGKKIAVDATLYVCMLKMRSGVYVDTIVDFLATFRQHGVNALFVFDGVAPDEKQGERLARSDKRACQHERIEKLERDLDLYKQTNEPSDLLRNLPVLKTRRLAPKILSVQVIEEYIAKLKSQIHVFSWEDFNIMKDLLDLFGIPYVTAPGEGEFLCAALNRHGLVDAVMTADTDALPCLAPTVITKIVNDYTTVTSLHDVLNLLKLDEKQFIDFCIMCGTDFNVNIPRIGPNSSYELILKHSNIDNVAASTNLNVECLNHVRVREIFSFTDNRPDLIIPDSSDVNFEGLKKYVRNTDALKKRLTKI